MVLNNHHIRYHYFFIGEKIAIVERRKKLTNTWAEQAIDARKEPACQGFGTDFFSEALSEKFQRCHQADNIAELDLLRPGIGARRETKILQIITQ